MKRQAYMPKSKSQTHLTPDRVYDMIEEKWGYSKEEMYDPCPAYTPYRSPIFFNGLYGDWHDVNYVNSPFAVKTLEAFVTKAHEQSLKGKTTIVLLPLKTDQDWFHDIILKYDYLYNAIWIRKRLKFKNDKDSAHASHFLVMIN